MSTIAAISTAPGVGGIGIVRMSGENCFEILDRFFVQKNKQKIENIKGYSIKYGTIIDNNEIIDEVLVSYFKAPKSYTTENMCEINSHGGSVIINKILDICLKNGAELAQPGEFTKRAFLNGRIDLTQAEAVIDVINAKTDKEAKVSIEQLEGNLSRKIAEIRTDILDILSDIEANIDYPEYDIEETSVKKVSEFLDKIYFKLNKLENSFDNGKILREGVLAAIIGRPNAGKSSLLNLILDEERAIVTDIEGTTRDTIEEFISVDGIPLKIIDTAGIRNTEDTVEKIGVEKSLNLIEEAQLILLVLDASEELSEEDKFILEKTKDKKRIVILNKTDLSKVNDYHDEVISISAKNNIGIEKIKEKIKELFNVSDILNTNSTYFTNARQISLLKLAIEALYSVESAIKEGLEVDMIEIDLKLAWEKLGDIIGANYTEELVDNLFSRFCLGK